MKATAHKIKDNEWIAKYDSIEPSSMYPILHYSYPIVSPSDREWLEKNNMDGEEVDGYLGYDGKGSNSFHMHISSNTPPIHSDPAGEENKILKDALHALCISTVPLSLVSGTEVYDRVKIGTALLNRLGYYDESQPSTPQTGRTYTEGGWTDAQMIKAYEDGISAGSSNATRQYGDGWETSSGKEYLKTKRKKKP